MTPRRLLALLGVSLFGHAQWFFGNLYEAVVTVPQARAAPESIRPEGALFAPGSPVRSYIPVTPLALLATVVALPLGWRLGRVRRGWLAVAAVCSIAAEALTAYIITRINLKLFFGPGITAPADRSGDNAAPARAAPAGTVP